MPSLHVVYMLVSLCETFQLALNFKWESNHDHENGIIDGLFFCISEPQEGKESLMMCHIKQ